MAMKERTGQGSSPAGSSSVEERIGTTTATIVAPGEAGVKGQPERHYALGRYPIVVHLVDPRVIDRTRCLLRVVRYVPEEMVGRLSLCHRCEQDERAELAGGGER